MKDPITAWAAAALKRAPAAKALRAKLDRKPSPLAARFALDPLERRILELAHAVERAFDVAKIARAAAGGLTVELVRATLGDDVDAALSPKRALRRHALVAVGNSGGHAAATDLVRTAPGVSARLDGAADPEALWLGVARIVPNGRGEVPARVAALLRDLDAATATLVTLDGCPRREAYELAAGLARSRGRGVLLVDGELLADAADPALLLACARRDADVDGDALIVCAAAALGERWRALLAPAATAIAPPLVLLADAERTRDPVAAAPFVVRRLSLHPPAPTAAAPVAEATRKEEPPVDDGLEQVRQLAIRDAERALGIYRAPPPPPRAAPPPSPRGAPLVPAPPTAADAPAPVAPAVVAAPPAAVAAAAAPPANPPALPRKMSAKAMQHFAAKLGIDPSAAAADAPAAPPPEAPVVTPAAPVAAPVPLATVVADAAELVDGTPLPIAANATPDELARAASTSPSASQRIELIGRIRLHKTASVVAALRANAANPHPGVRAAAEGAMASLFGPNWNTTRPVPKPIQRPPSDDKDRGPPGGY